MGDKLILSENENGFFVNGNRVNEETYLALSDDLDDENVDYDNDIEDTEDNDCEICQMVEDLMIAAKNPDYDYAYKIMHEMVEDILNDAYFDGLQTALDNVSNFCQEVAEKLDED